ncbi:unnamed protein product [Ixodes pacificus]
MPGRGHTDSLVRPPLRSFIRLWRSSVLGSDPSPPGEPLSPPSLLSDFLFFTVASPSARSPSTVSLVAVTSRSPRQGRTLSNVRQLRVRADGDRCSSRSRAAPTVLFLAVSISRVTFRLSLKRAQG